MNKAIVKGILLVEDEAIVAKVQIKQLQNYGYNVIHLLTGEAAVELLADGNTPVQLVLMDIDLGAGMDGTQAAQIILKKRDIPIVFLSSHTEPDVVEKTEKISSFGYVVKGSGITVLDASIKMAFKLHQARAEARARELHYRQMFEKNLSVKLIIDPVDGRIIEANQAACDFYGYDNRTITGMKITDINTLSEAEVHAEMQSARREDRLYFNFKHRLADGSVKEVEVYSSPLQKNERTLLYSIIHDITDRRRAEEDLKKFRMAIEQSPVSVVMTDPDGNINYVNPRFSEITGYAPEEVLGKNPRFQKSGLTPLEMYSDMWKTILSGETWQGEIVNRARDGRLYWEHILITPILDEEDRITSFLGIKENITHRKKSEEVLRISQEKLLDAQYMAHLGDFSWDLRTNEVTWSDGMYALMKFQRDENFDFAKINDQIHHPEDREWVEQWLEQAIQSGLEYFPPQEYRLVRNDGKVIWVRTNIHVLYENEKPIFLNGICQDITERKETEQAIRRLLAEKETIIKETHHRIKNNVASIESLLNFYMDGVSNEESRAHLKEAIGMLTGMRVLYDKLLRSEHQAAHTDQYIEDLSQSILKFYREKTAIELTLDIVALELQPNTLFPLGIIVNELLTNAMKHAFPDRDEGRIHISLQIAPEKKDFLQLTVMDDGPGFPADFSSESGAGFGISLVKMLAESMGGSMLSDNRQGARVVVEFPCQSG